MSSLDWDSLLQQASTATGVAGSREPVPADDYLCECIKAEGVNSSTGKPMVKATFKIVGGPYDGRWIFNNFTLSVDNPNALAFFFAHMAAFGLDRNFFAAKPSISQVAAQIVGKRVMLKVGQREWNGEMRNEVKNVSAAQAAAPPMAAFAPPIPPAPAMAPAPAPTFAAPTMPPPAPPVMPAPAPVAAPAGPMPDAPPAMPF